jgi:hypothetical protein
MTPMVGIMTPMSRLHSNYKTRNPNSQKAEKTVVFFTVFSHKNIFSLFFNQLKIQKRHNPHTDLV